jgi:hypothetical protein
MNESATLYCVVIEWRGCMIFVFKIVPSDINRRCKFSQLFQQFNAMISFSVGLNSQLKRYRIYLSLQYCNKSKSQLTSPTPAQLPAVA